MGSKKKLVTIRIRKFDPKLADDILASLSALKKPPGLRYNPHEGCHEASFELIYDKKSGKYWCGYGIYYILDAKKEIEIRNGEVEIVNPSSLEYIGRK